MSINEAEASAIFQYLFNKIAQGMSEGYTVIVPGFGLFVPKNGRPYFVPSEHLEDKVIKNQPTSSIKETIEGRIVKAKE